MTIEAEQDNLAKLKNIAQQMADLEQDDDVDTYHEEPYVGFAGCVGLTYNVRDEGGWLLEGFEVDDAGQQMLEAIKRYEATADNDLSEGGRMLTSLASYLNIQL
jgi:hypothetical protein